MSQHIVNTRRSLRVPARCPVRAQAGEVAFEAETEDVGPHGCRLVGPWGMPPGQPIRLAIASPRLLRVLQAAGRIAWVSASPPWRHGVAFHEEDRVDGHRWFDELVAAEPELLLHDRVPDRLPPEALLFLGPPPGSGAELSADEVEVLRRIGEGTTLRELRLRLEASWPRSLRALLSLLARHAVTMAREEAACPEAWARWLSARPATAPSDPARPGP